MITKKNIEDALSVLGFKKNEAGEYVKVYGSLEKAIVVDCEKGSISWPNGLTARSDTTSNFSAPENFVVLECVDRLLSKGYHPEHLVLEETWLIGHEQKGGRADICVYNDDEHHDLLLIVECKTAGEEFRRYRRQLFADGGQLFSYWQQNRTAKWLCLYASDLVAREENGQTTPAISYRDSLVVISCEDDKNLEKTAETDDSILLYKRASSFDQLFQVWDETYNKQTYPDVIFGPDTQAYKIGVRPLRKKDLRPFSPDDGIVNRFLEILRHNNVSDRENAFNKLVSLFICKLVDEVTKDDEDELDFQYRAIRDSYEDLQDRLQRLYRDGMNEFMDEKIFYVENDYADKLFAQYSGARRKNAIDDLRDTIRKLKFYSNNEFAFKDVHNEELFLQNGKILVEVVQLFEQFKIVYTERNQLLGDLFEQLLNKGFKQNNGQFFTATPITRFVWDALPLERVARRGGKLRHPRVIDYACGAGHFLTEAVEAVNAYFAAEGGRPSKDNAWVEKSIYGVEKDYRLARVSKVSLHMNGAGKGQIVFGDGLENYPERGIDNGRFDILVANPPYSVEAFKAHLKLRDNKLSILDCITDQGSEIEALFVERIAQLLKPRGLAAVVLPSTILTTGEGPYVEARRELLANFNVRAIVALSKNAFQATSTETVVLFLEKYDEPPKRARLVEDSVSAILSGAPPDEWEDRAIFDAYVAHVGVSEADYLAFVSRKRSWTAWRDHPYFGAYCKAFDAISEYRSKREKKAFLALPAAERDAEVSAWFYDHWLKGVERDKLMEFGLVYRQKTLVVKSPDDKNAERAFLGYTWSNRRGQEGIKVESPGGLLYADADRRAEGTIAAGIRDAFGETPPAIETGAEYAHYLPLRDLIDFSRPKFDVAINIERQAKKSFDSRYPLVALSECAEIVRGVTYAKEDQVADRTDNVILTADNITLGGELSVQKEVFLRESFSIDSQKALKKGDCFICLSSGSRQHVGKVAYIDHDLHCYAGGFMGILRAFEKTCLAKYLFELLNSPVGRDVVRQESGGANIKNLSNSIGEIKIPLPALSVQQKVVAECAKIDVVCAKLRKQAEADRGEIDQLVEKLLSQAGRVMSLGDDKKFSLAIGKRVVDSQLSKNGTVPVMSANVFEPMGMIDDELLSDYSEDSVLWGIDGDWMVNVVKAGKKFYPTDHCGVLRVKTSELLPFVAARLLERAGRAAGFKRSNRASIERIAALQISVPPLGEQEVVVGKVEKLEAAIASAERQLSAASSSKASILARILG